MTDLGNPRFTKNHTPPRKTKIQQISPRNSASQSLLMPDSPRRIKANAPKTMTNNRISASTLSHTGVFAQSVRCCGASAIKGTFAGNCNGTSTYPTGSSPDTRIDSRVLVEWEEPMQRNDIGRWVSCHLLCSAGLHSERQSAGGSLMCVSWGVYRAAPCFWVADKSRTDDAKTHVLPRLRFEAVFIACSARLKIWRQSSP